MMDLLNNSAKLIAEVLCLTMSINFYIKGDLDRQNCTPCTLFYSHYKSGVKMQDFLKRTGRTTRMLEFAVKQAKAGKKVVVYFDNKDERRHHVNKVLGNWQSAQMSITRDGTRITAESGGAITFGFVGRNFDWRVLRDRDIHPETVVLVDHHAIEDRFPALTEMLYRFMKP